MSTKEDHSDESFEEALFAEVVLPLPLKKLFTYRIPAEFFELAMPGKRVFVPFGNRKVYTGIIISIGNRPPEHYEALNIISVIDDNPVIQQPGLDFWNWVADYYMCGLGDVMAAALPAGLRMASESYVSIQEGADYDPGQLDERELRILEVLKGKEKVRISDIETTLKSKTSFVKIIKSLYERQLIVMFEDVPDRYRPRKQTGIRPAAGMTDTQIEEHLARLEKKAPVQFRTFLALLGEPGMEATKQDFLKKYDLPSAAIKALEEKGLIVSFEKDAGDPGSDAAAREEINLTPAQKNALGSVRDFFESDRNVLLHGVASSGKTFIYIELIREAIARGKSVLYLIPELALTEQLIQRLERYFGPEMMVSHSRFSKSEKVEIWNKAVKGEIRLLLGSRSAIFMPLQDTGLIIIDEEHEPAFKQQEKSPRYHARDAALVLARQTGARVIMGSATPSAESYHNALTGKYGLVELNERYGETSETDVIFADIKEETRTKKIRGIFTAELVSRLEELPRQKAQAILFQNRKGYVPMLECSVCGWVSKCMNCDIALTYYKYTNNLRCHYCGYHQPNISKCSACGNNSMSIQGYGTERITEELQLILPELRIIRFDQDSTRQKGAFRKILNDFELGHADVMVGTQIAVKGLDYGNVKLTAVVNADHLLNFPDFRSHERTFQLLVQLAGRAGRKGGKGVMVVQTRQTDHPVFNFVLNNDYRGFIRAQLLEREQFHYAPFSKMIRLTMKHADVSVVNRSASAFSLLLRNQLGARLLGPETPYVARIRNLHLRNFLLKLDPEKDNIPAIKDFIQKTFDYLILRDQLKGLQLSVDVDPY